MNVHAYAAILAGGQGARFWPISRMAFPKQFLSISSCGESLISATARRLSPLISPDHVLVITNVKHEKLIREHVPHAKIVCEPVPRNTAAAIGLAALHVRRLDPQGVMLLLPADHAVVDEVQQRAVLERAAELAESEDLLVTVGIKPTSPNTAYGYIQRGEELRSGSYRVRHFYEKPSLERARQYFDADDFYWNSGMFLWRAELILAALQAYLPQLYAGLLEIDAALGSAAEQEVLNRVFPQLEAISIDFGVMEHARNTAVVAAEPFGWNDVGSWDAWAEHFQKDAEGNLTHGEALLIDSHSCVVHSQQRLTAVLGVKDILIIDSGDALLVCHKDCAQDVKKIVNRLKGVGRQDLL